jgi:hypothetical protein
LFFVVGRLGFIFVGGDIEDVDLDLLGGTIANFKVADKLVLFGLRGYN